MGIIWETTVWVFQGDTRSLDYRSHGDGILVLLGPPFRAALCRPILREGPGAQTHSFQACSMACKSEYLASSLSFGFYRAVLPFKP